MNKQEAKAALNLRKRIRHASWNPEQWIQLMPDGNRLRMQDGMVWIVEIFWNSRCKQEKYDEGWELFNMPLQVPGAVIMKGGWGFPEFFLPSGEKIPKVVEYQVQQKHNSHAVVQLTLLCNVEPSGNG